jgi:hypothetical protein
LDNGGSWTKECREPRRSILLHIEIVVIRIICRSWLGLDVHVIDLAARALANLTVLLHVAIEALLKSLFEGHDSE